MSGVTWKDWNPQRVKAHIAGTIVQNMEVACKFVEGQARSNARSAFTSRTGKTVRDISHEISSEVGAFGNAIEGRVGVLKGKGKAWYAFFLEFGTRKMRARPFLRPAVFNNAREIVRIIAGK